MMQGKNKFMDDMSQIMTNAMGVAQGAKDEAENAMKSLMDRWLGSCPVIYLGISHLSVDKLAK